MCGTIVQFIRWDSIMWSSSCHLFFLWLFFLPPCSVCNLSHLSNSLYFLDKLSSYCWEPVLCCCYISVPSSGAANNHVVAFFQGGPVSVFSDSLGYSLLKNAGTQIYGHHLEVFSQTPLYSVLWANIGLRAYVILPVTYIFWTFVILVIAWNLAWILLLLLR